MCGIAGIFSKKDDGDRRQEAVARMLKEIVRRGPDSEGMLSEGPVTFGHRRLKIVDLSEAGRQPMESHCGRYVMIYNGEVYNYLDLAKELKLDAAKLRSRTDTEILLEAWAAWGPACLPRLVGQFAFAVYDRREQEVWLARDRFGEKPLFYHTAGGRLSFASSIASLLQAPGVPRQLDAAAIQEYVTLRYVVAPNTVMKDVRKLAGGSALRFDGSTLDLRQWYDPQYTGGQHAGVQAQRDELAETFDHLFRQATQRCLMGDVPVGLMLSDGIDSNAILAVLDDLAPNLSCFTYGYDNKVTALTKGAKAGASAAKRRLFEYNFSADARVAAMSKAFAGLTEPIGDGAALASWLLLERASSEAKVFLCGHGSDELLGGYRLHQDRFRLRVLRYLSYLPQAAGDAAFERFLYGAEGLTERVRGFKSAGRAALPAAARYIIHRPLPVADLLELYQGQGQGRFRDDTYLATIQQLYGRCQPSALDIDRIQKVMIHTFLSENILSFADSVGMDSSVELRVPFLDRDLVDFVLRLPVEARVGFWPGGTNTKLILRWWGKTHLDPAVLNRPKHSFDFGSLRPLMKSHGPTLRAYMLGSSALRQALPGLETWLSHPPEYYRGCWQGTMWALLSLGVWCQAHGVEAA